ncbi:3-oxoacyl-(acyl-carrier protein) reductase [Vibrio ishigakensis]|uniref:3-oxoacyl-(Acyl-carrier protein) reductase n=1 Tax=Vibrio ishigakensis TaxID=1481914 RepID=A0A0B8P934_9VIBR|nr:3-oxoacyl-(acyl-carrier protein) reductase [Vibrio ishigakensis]
MNKFIIVGGTSGIGKALANTLINQGHEVIVGSRRTGLDIQDNQSIVNFFKSAGEFDHLIITAGSYAPSGEVKELNLAEAADAFDTKFWGSMRLVQQATPYLKSSITLTSGMLSRKPVANTLVKTAANAALEASAKVLAKELAPVRVNIVSPGLTQTEAYSGMSDDARQAMFENASKSLPLGKVATADDLVGGYLLAIENPVITGSVIDINGGALL